MDRLTKLLVTAIILAVAQTVTTVAIFQNAIGAVSALFCWAVVLVVARRRAADRCRGKA